MNDLLVARSAPVCALAPFIGAFYLWRRPRNQPGQSASLPAAARPRAGTRRRTGPLPPGSPLIGRPAAT